MKALIDNWYLFIIAMVVITFWVYCIYVFLKKPTQAQISSIKQWMLYAVTEAEKELGSGTGQLKLRYVYNMFIGKFGNLKNVITFDMVSIMIDEALTTMRHLMTTNPNIKEYIEGDNKKKDENNLIDTHK